MGDTKNKPQKKQSKHATLLWGMDDAGKDRNALPEDSPLRREPSEDSESKVSDKTGTTAPDDGSEEEIEDLGLEQLRAKWEKRNAEQKRKKDVGSTKVGRPGDATPPDKPKSPGDAKTQAKLKSPGDTKKADKARTARSAAAIKTLKKDFSRAKTLLATPDKAGTEVKPKGADSAKRPASKISFDKSRTLKAPPAKAAPPGKPKPVNPFSRKPLNKTVLGGPRVVLKTPKSAIGKESQGARSKVSPERAKTLLGTTAAATKKDAPATLNSSEAEKKIPEPLPVEDPATMKSEAEKKIPEPARVEDPATLESEAAKKIPESVPVEDPATLESEAGPTIPEPTIPEPAPMSAEAMPEVSAPAPGDDMEIPITTGEEAASAEDAFPEAIDIPIIDDVEESSESEASSQDERVTLPVIGDTGDRTEAPNTAERVPVTSGDSKHRGIPKILIAIVGVVLLVGAAALVWFVFLDVGAPFTASHVAAPPPTEQPAAAEAIRPKPPKPTPPAPSQAAPPKPTPPAPSQAVPPPKPTPAPEPAEAPDEAEGQEARGAKGDPDDAAEPAEGEEAGATTKRPAGEAEDAAGDDDTVLIQLSGAPRHAEVFIDGKRARPPYRVPKRKKSVKIEVRKEGFSPLVKRVVPNRDKVIRARMKRE